MKAIKFFLPSIILVFMISSCNQKQLDLEVYETSASGNKLTKVTNFSSSENQSKIILNPEKKYQTITNSTYNY